MQLKLFLLSFFVPVLAWSLEVRWEEPQMTYSSQAGWTEVLLKGELAPNTVISFSQEYVIVIRGKDFRKLATQTIYGSQESVTSNEAGEVSWKLLIPYGRVQLPLKLTGAEGSVEFFNLGLVVPQLSPPPPPVQAKEEAVAPEPVVEKEEPPQPSFFEKVGGWSSKLWNMASVDPRASHMWLGVGYTQNYLVQDSTAFGRELDFYSYYLPSLYAEFQHYLSNRWNVGAYYLHLPGQATSSSDLSVSPSSYTKSVVGLTTDYYLYSSYRSLSQGLKWNWAVRSELQYLNIPFPERKVVDATQINIGSISPSLFSLGPRFLFYHNEKWTYEADFQYQVLALDDSRAELSSLTAYSYCLGVSRGIANWRFGLFHSSQVFNGDYSIESAGLAASGSSDTKDRGRLETKHTLLELRLGYSF